MNSQMHYTDTGRSNEITRKEMYVIERRADGSLQTAFHPIRYDSQVLDRLCDLSQKMMEWENAQRRKLVNGIGRLDSELVGEHKSDVHAIANRFCDLVFDICSVTRVKGYNPAISDPSHYKWHYKPGVHSLVKYSEFIRGFNVSYEAIKECRKNLDDHSYQRLERAYSLAVNMKDLLLNALNLYEKVFYAYVDRVGKTYPEALRPKKYCQAFSEAYGDAELDYDMTPGNQCLVERIREYYWACVMEQQYREYESMGNVVAYSHRKLGFNDYQIILDPECDLRLWQKTNYGFGRVRYFWSTLIYKGISAINASFLIFFEGARKVSFSEHTFNYEVAEESFKSCFDEAVMLHNEYREIGEAAFVDKHFRKSLADLSDLLLIVANTDTFLRITTLEQFDALTSGARNLLIPDEGFRDIDFELSATEKKAVDDIAKAILKTIETSSIKECKNDVRIKELTDKVLGPYEPNALQLIVKKDLTRSRVTRILASSLPERYDVSSLVNEIIPPDKGVLIDTYEGFDLINMRIEKARSVIQPIARLREIAALTESEPIIDSIATTCGTIAKQAQLFISKEIAPELGRRIPERDRIKAQLDGASNELKAMKRRGGNTNWIEGQIRGLRAQLLNLNNEIAALTGQERTLKRYIRSVEALQAKR